MTEYYLVNYQGAGTRTSPFRPLGVDGVADASWIDLRPDAAVQSGKAIVALPATAVIAGAIHLGGGTLASLLTTTVTVRNQVGNALGITLTNQRIDNLVYELLTSHARTDGTRWRPLQAERNPFGVGQVERIYLGGLLVNRPVVAGGSTVSETWTAADSASLTADNAWTEYVGTAWAIVSNQAKLTGTASGWNFARLDANLASINHSCQVTGVTLTRAGGVVAYGPICRKDSAATDTCYYFYAELFGTGSGSWDHQLYKRVTGTDTSIGATVTDDPVAGDVLKIEANGSTINAYINGVLKRTATDTSITSGLRVGIIGYSDDVGNVAILDNLTGVDLAAASFVIAWPSTVASIPAGWERQAALDDRYLKGAAAATEPGDTGGALTHSHTSTAHAHTTAHTHTVPNGPAGAGSSSRDTGTTNPPPTHTHLSNPSTIDPTTTLANDTPSTDAVNHEPPFHAVVWIGYSAGGAPTGIPVGAVGFWSNTAGGPTSWGLCDGTGARPDLRGKFLKGAAAAANAGATGGGATHSHAVASHTHTTPYAHAHPNVTSSATATAMTSGDISGANVGVATQTHTHPLTIASASPVITGNTDTTGTGANEPTWRKLAPIINEAAGADLPDGFIGIWRDVLANIPASWKLCDGTNGTPDLRGLHLLCATTFGQAGDTGGGISHGHTATGHTHAVASHVHGVTAGAGAGENRTAGATATATTAHTHASWSDSGAASFTSGTGTPTIENNTDTQPPFMTVAWVMFTTAVAVTRGTPFGNRGTAFNGGRALQGVFR